MPIRILILIVPAVLIAGCSTARMPVSESLSEYMAVSGRQGWKIREQVRFGDFRAHAVDRSWTRGRDFSSTPLELNRRRQTYTFTLAEGDTDVWDVSCEVELGHGAVNTPIVDVEFRNHSRLDCWFVESGGANPAWTLSMEETRERPLWGRLDGPGAEFEVAGTNKLRRSLPMQETTGYHVRRDGADVAAVEVINAGGVWLGSGISADERSITSAAAAALLLLEDLRGYLSEA